MEDFNPTLEKQALQTITRNPNTYMLISSEPLELYMSQKKERKGRERLDVCVWSVPVMLSKLRSSAKSWNALIALGEGRRRKLHKKKKKQGEKNRDRIRKKDGVNTAGGGAYRG